MIDITIVHKFAERKLRGDDMKLYLVRHGCTDLNSENKEEDRLRGWLDVPLNEKGMKEADKAAQDLKNLSIEKLMASDLQRCRQTVQIISEYIGVKPVFDHAFRPLDLGEFAGESTLESIPHLKYYYRHEREPIPGGESLRSFLDRFLPALREQLKQVEKGKGPVAIVTSYRNLRAAAAWSKAGMIDNKIDMAEFLKDHTPTASITTWTWDGKEWDAGKPQEA